MVKSKWTVWGGALTRWLPLLLLTTACVALAQDNEAVAGGAATAPPAEDALNLRQIIEWGGIVGKIIIALSFVTLTLVGYHLVMLRKGVLMPRDAVESAGAMLRDHKLKDALEFTNEENSLFSRIVSAGISRIRGGWSEMEQIMGDVAEDEAMRLEQTVGYFSLLGAIAPLLGLLGTVIGMIIAFNQIATIGVVTPKELANPIQRALVTTCFGLIVAIPNVAAYTLFRNRLRRLLVEVSVAVEEVTFPYRGLKPITAAAAAAVAGKAAAAAAAAKEPASVDEDDEETSEHDVAGKDADN